MIDILLSTYNGANFLGEQIESIINQSYSKWRLLIRDDGSSDLTVQIINHYCQLMPDRIVHISDSLGNIGSLKSFEILLAESNKPYIMFCDQDDIWLPHKIEKSLDALNTLALKYDNENTPLIICSDLIVTDESLSILSESYWHFSKINPRRLKSKYQLCINNYITGCTMLFNKKAKDISMPFGKYALIHDAWIALKVVQNNGVIYPLKGSHIYYRQHTSNQVGAISIKYNLKYLLKKIISIKNVLNRNYLNYKQANEACQISLIRFVFNRIIYLITR